MYNSFRFRNRLTVEFYLTSIFVRRCKTEILYTERMYGIVWIAISKCNNHFFFFFFGFGSVETGIVFCKCSDIVSMRILNFDHPFLPGLCFIEGTGIKFLLICKTDLYIH